MLERWESAVATLVVVLALVLGLYFFYYLPYRAPTPGLSPERTVPGSLEDTAPTTRMEGTVRATGKSPPVGKSQYSSPGATGP
jgi:multidrug efflux pump subunit AcrA (membrane-fusion protein)